LFENELILIKLKNNEDQSLTVGMTSLMVRDFDIVATQPQQMTEVELFQLLANEVADMIEYRIDLLLSRMYRLDVLEVDIQAALDPTNPVAANVALAHLIWERQRQRVLSKRTHPVPDIDPEWQW
jgi:hypothetical protein